MNELLMWTPAAVVALITIIAQVIRGNSGGEAATQTATRAATEAATSITMAALKEATQHLSDVLERLDRDHQDHERRIVMIEVACRMRHVERRQEAVEAGGV